MEASEDTRKLEGYTDVTKEGRTHLAYNITEYEVQVTSGPQYCQVCVPLQIAFTKVSLLN